MTLKYTDKAQLKALDEYQVVLAQEGDRQAFELLYRRWHPKLLRLACRLLGEPEAAQDVMQDAAMTIAKNISRLQDPSRFSAWAYTIVRRRVADHISKAVKTRDLKQKLIHTSIDVAGVSPDEKLTLKQGLSHLSEAEQLLLKLFYTDGLTAVEIAAAMGIPLGTVKSRLYKARQNLKSIYKMKGDQNE